MPSRKHASTERGLVGSRLPEPFGSAVDFFSLQTMQPTRSFAQQLSQEHTCFLPLAFSMISGMVTLGRSDRRDSAFACCRSSSHS